MHANRYTGTFRLLTHTKHHQVDSEAQGDKSPFKNTTRTQNRAECKHFELGTEM